MRILGIINQVQKKNKINYSSIVYVELLKNQVTLKVSEKQTKQNKHANKEKQTNKQKKENTTI